VKLPLNKETGYTMKIYKTSGFTLIELMITVAILAIIAGIALPSYQESIRKTRRSDGKVALMDAAGLQETWFSSNNSYTNLISNIGGNASPEGFYTITVANPSCSSTVNGVTVYSCFTLTATATGTQTSDAACSPLTLTHTGIKAPTTSDCW
jgi:type IV pilus assembly protein PilE